MKIASSQRGFQLSGVDCILIFILKYLLPSLKHYIIMQLYYYVPKVLLKYYSQNRLHFNTTLCHLTTRAVTRFWQPGISPHSLSYQHVPWILLPFQKTLGKQIQKNFLSRAFSHARGHLRVSHGPRKKGDFPRFSPLAGTPLTKSEEKERLLAVYLMTCTVDSCFNCGRYGNVKSY